MWWGGSERVAVYLGETLVGVARVGNAEAATVVWQPVEGATAGFEWAVKWLGDQPCRNRARTLDVSLSGSLARPFVLEPIIGLKSRREAVDVAVALAPAATGLAGPCMVWLDDWVAGQRCIAVAVDAQVRNQLELAAAAQGMKLAALRPWWSVALDAANATSNDSMQLLAVEDADSITVFSSEGNIGYTALATYAPKPASIQARAVVTRAAMAGNVSVNGIAVASMGSSSVLSNGGVTSNAPAQSFVPLVERWQ